MLYLFVKLDKSERAVLSPKRHSFNSAFRLERRWGGTPMILARSEARNGRIVRKQTRIFCGVIPSNALRSEIMAGKCFLAIAINSLHSSSVTVYTYFLAFCVMRLTMSESKNDCEFSIKGERSLYCFSRLIVS